jgi:Glycosyltransferase like family
MLAFATAVSDWATYEQVALPGIERAAEPDSLVLTRTGRTIWTAYNEMMDEAAEHPDVEALVLLHQDLELTDDSLPGRARRLFSDPRIGIAGPLGARNVRLHVYLSSRDLYGVVKAPGVDRRFSDGGEEVEGIDGALFVLAPWVIRGLRFGGGLADGFHGYDVDISWRVRAHGGRAVCEDIPYFHRHEPKGDFAGQRRAGLALARMWDPGLRPREWAPAFHL